MLAITAVSNYSMATKIQKLYFSICERPYARACRAKNKQYQNDLILVFEQHFFDEFDESIIYIWEKSAENSEEKYLTTFFSSLERFHSYIFFIYLHMIYAKVCAQIHFIFLINLNAV